MSRVLYTTAKPRYIVEQRTEEGWEGEEGFGNLSGAIHEADRLQKLWPGHVYRVVENEGDGTQDGEVTQ